MSDQMTIVGKDGNPRYILDEKNRVRDVRPHEHEFSPVTAICKICGRTKLEIEQEQ